LLRSPFKLPLTVLHLRVLKLDWATGIEQGAILQSAIDKPALFYAEGLANEGLVLVLGYRHMAFSKKQLIVNCNPLVFGREMPHTGGGYPMLH
jgi:hypothetical protein